LCGHSGYSYLVADDSEKLAVLEIGVRGHLGLRREDWGLAYESKRRRWVTDDV
jgi:hypothetical protein